MQHQADTDRVKVIKDHYMRKEKSFNAVLTGGAGTGKSTVIQAVVFLLRDLLKLNVLVHGSTGIAASNIEGFTVHSLQNLNSYFEAIRGSQKTEYA